MTATWWDVVTDPRATWVRMLVGDPGGRWHAGETGILVANDYPEKYDAMVLLPPVYDQPYTAAQIETERAIFAGPFAGLIGSDRAFYQYACDLAYERGPGYGPWKLGLPSPPHDERCAEQRHLAGIIAHDARAGL